MSDLETRRLETLEAAWAENERLRIDNERPRAENERLLATIAKTTDKRTA